MSIPTFKTAIAASLLAFAAAGASAQTGTATPPPPPPGAGPMGGPPPAPVGVTPQTAAEANQRAVPNPNVGTVVRTEPSAADRARNAAGNAGMNSGTGMNSGAGMNPGMRADPAMPRRARADRN